MDAQTLGAYGADALYPGWDGGYSGSGGGMSDAAPVETAHGPAGSGMGTGEPTFWAFLVLVAILLFTRIAYELAGDKPGQG